MLKSPQYRKILEGSEDLIDEDEETDKIKSFSILDGSHLSKQLLGVKDFVNYLTDMSDLERNQISQIPNSTKECYIEWVAKKRLTPNDTKGIFNELLPLLFFSLKMSVPDSENVTDFVVITCLDDFISQDPD